MMALAVLAAGVASPAFGQNRGPLIENLRREHPRLILTQSDWSALKSSIKSDPVKGAWFAQLRGDADQLVDKSPTRNRRASETLLFLSRDALKRLATLGAMYQLTGDKRYADAARREMFTVIAFPDWNPSSFLDTSEMIAAVSLGYDWTYNALSPDDRKTIAAAIVKMGLEPGMSQYDSHAFWLRDPNNWNIVCHTGLSMGALAVADVAPDIAEKTLDFAMQDLPASLNTWAPNGEWPEGAAYWAYASQYNVMLLASLQSALGGDLGMSSAPGFSEAGYFPIYMTGPTGLIFNFADADPAAKSEPIPQMFWLAHKFHQPAFAAYREKQILADRPTIWDLLYAVDPVPRGPQAIDSLPLQKTFHGVQDIGAARNSWEDPNDGWVAVKGGDNKAGHSHLDLGSFVYEFMGQRWAADPGRDDYSAPGYFGKGRYLNFRTSTKAHNTLVVDNQNQAVNGKAAIVSSGMSGPNDYYFVLDLSQAYNIGRVQRKIELLHDHSLTVTDDVDANGPHQITWNLLTAANVNLQGQTASLSLGGRTLYARIVSPPGAQFQVQAGSGPAPEAQAQGLKRLVVALPPAQKVHIVVTLSANAGR